MDTKDESELIALAPWMFTGYRKSPEESCLAFGIETGPGWKQLLHDLITELAAVDINKCIIVDQIKEKYGALRYYYHLEGKCSYDKEIDKIIAKYEKMSETTCEECGKKGKIISKSGWLSCRCKEHKGE